MYNPSITRLSNRVWSRLCEGLAGAEEDGGRGSGDSSGGGGDSGEKSGDGGGDVGGCVAALKASTGNTTDVAYALSWFGKAPGSPSGCVTYVGVARLSALRKLMQVMPPRFSLHEPRAHFHPLPTYSSTTNPSYLYVAPDHPLHVWTSAAATRTTAGKSHREALCGSHLPQWLQTI